MSKTSRSKKSKFDKKDIFTIITLILTSIGLLIGAYHYKRKLDKDFK